MQQSDLDVAYCAGFIDGEGCITVSNNGSIVVSVINTSQVSLDFLVDVLGGKYTKRKQMWNKPQFCYRLYGDGAKDGIVKMLPYLKEKKDQAVAILMYYEERDKYKEYRIPGVKGRLGHPDRKLLIKRYQQILTQMKQGVYVETV